MSAPHVSVVVPTIDRPDLVVKCIDGVRGGALQDFEIVVVDQSANGQTRTALEARYAGDARVRYVHSAVSGAARARNLGVDHACGELLAFVDDDAIPEPGWLAAYARAFREISPSPGMVGGRIRPLWAGECPAWFPPQLMHVVGAYDAGDRSCPFPPGDFPMSGNFALPRAVMKDLGGFDERLGFDVRRRNPLLGGEDSHLGLKVAHSGRSVWYYPDAVVRHLVRASKLTPRYLLRRQYWQGRTWVELRRRRDGDRRGWLSVLRDARMKRAALPSPREAPKGGVRAAVMRCAALTAFAAGATAEVVVGGVRAG